MEERWSGAKFWADVGPRYRKVEHPGPQLDAFFLSSASWRRRLPRLVSLCPGEFCCSHMLHTSAKDQVLQQIPSGLSRSESYPLWVGFSEVLVRLIFKVAWWSNNNFNTLFLPSVTWSELKIGSALSGNLDLPRSLPTWIILWFYQYF